MKRFLSFLATFSLIEAIGRHPATAGALMLLGVGGGAVGGALLTTPTIVPQPTAFFSNGNAAATNNGLKTPANAFETPAVPTHSMGLLVEGSVSPGLGFSGAAGTQYALGLGTVANNFQGLQISDNISGLPAFYFQKVWASTGTTSWWQAQGFNLVSTSATDGGTVSSYNPGYYPFTATGGLCPGAGAREPSGVFGGTNNTSQVGGVDITDPGFLLCSVPTITLAAIPNSGAQQATGAGSVATTCVSNSPVSGQATVTATVTVPHGITPGQTYTLQGFTGAGNVEYGSTATPVAAGSFSIGTPYTISSVGTTNFVAIGASSNTVGVTFTATGVGSGTGTALLGFGVVTYTALPGSSGATLVGETRAGGGACPANSPATAEGTALGGTGGTITMPAISTIGATGITTKNDQKFCALVTENGDDSPFPGSQAVAIVDDHGNPLPGAPALVPYLNQGTANFNGFIVPGAQSAGHPSLTVTSMIPYTITGATYSATTGFVTFTTSTPPMFEPGSEFTVSGISPSGYNQTYVAVAGTTLTGTTIVGNPLSAALGTPQAISNPGSFVSGGTMVSVIMPGMRIYGSNLTTGLGFISPFGTDGGTGTGGTGTYAISTNPPAPFAFAATAVAGVFTGSSATVQQFAPGAAFTMPGLTGTPTITGFGTGTGLNGTYAISDNTENSLSTTVSTASWLANQITFTLGTTPSVTPTAGESINVAGITPTGYNGTFTVVSASGANIVVAKTTNPGTYVSGGRVVGNAVFTGGMWSDPSSGGTAGILFAAPPFYQSIVGVAGTLPGSPSTAFTTVPVAQATIGDFVTAIGTEITTSVAGGTSTGWSGTLANVADLWMPGATSTSGGFPMQAGGAPSTSALAGLCKKNPNNDIQQFAAANGFTVHSLYRLNDPGIFGDSSNATIQGYVTNTSGTNATLNVVFTTQGSLALPTGTETANVTGVGLPVASPATIPLTTSSSSTYAMTPNTTAAVGSLSFPATINVGAFAPAVPTPTSAVNGWIDQPGGVPTLHVTSSGNSAPNVTATFTGSLNVAFTGSISGTTLTVTLPAIGNGGLQQILTSESGRRSAMWRDT